MQTTHKNDDHTQTRHNQAKLCGIRLFMTQHVLFTHEHICTLYSCCYTLAVLAALCCWLFILHDTIVFILDPIPIFAIIATTTFWLVLLLFRSFLLIFSFTKFEFICMGGTCPIEYTGIAVFIVVVVVDRFIVVVIPPKSTLLFIGVYFDSEMSTFFMLARTENTAIHRIRITGWFRLLYDAFFQSSFNAILDTLFLFSFSFRN